MKEVQYWSENQPFPDTVTIAMLGNSITAYANWNEVLGRNDVLNFGVTDFTIKQLSWILAKWVIASKPKICFINGGQEDILLGVPLERIADDYSMLIDSLQNNGIKPVVQACILSWNDPEKNIQLTNVNRLMEAICDEKDIDFINLNTVLSDGTGLKPQVTTDGMHLNRKGYQLWAIMLKDYLLLNNPTENM